MIKKKKKLNTETLSYEKRKRFAIDNIWKGLGLLISGTSIGLIAFLVISYTVDSPEEVRLKREKKELLSQYNIMNEELVRINKVLSEMENRDNNIYRVIFETDPINESIRRAGTGGSDKYEKLRGLKDASIVINTSKRINELSKALYIQSKSYDEVEKLVKEKVKMVSSIPAIVPIALGDKRVRVSSPFGYRMHPYYKTVKLHAGMDFSAPIGTNVYSSGKGVVKSTRVERGYGNTIRISHGYGYVTVYAHISKFNVKPGQKVERGDLIGFVGDTGLSFGSHLHYEVRKNDQPINPINFYYNDLTPNEYDAMIEAANNNAQTMD